MRIVIDTNVLLSGFLWHGTPHALFNHSPAVALQLIETQPRPELS